MSGEFSIAKTYIVPLHLCTPETLYRLLRDFIKIIREKGIDDKIEIVVLPPLELLDVVEDEEFNIAFEAETRLYLQDQEGEVITYQTVAVLCVRRERNWLLHLYNPNVDPEIVKTVHSTLVELLKAEPA